MNKIRVFVPFPKAIEPLEKITRFLGLWGVFGSETAAKNYKKAIEMHPKLELVGSAEEADIIHVPDLFQVLFFLKPVKRPIVANLHAIPEDISGLLSGKREKIKWFAETAWSLYIPAIKRCSAVILPSEVGARLFTQYLVRKLDQSPLVFAVTNGVDTEKFRYIEREPRGKAVIGTLTTVTPGRGVKDFVEYAKKLKNHVFVWYGHIPSILRHHPSVKSVIKNTAANTFFFGFVKNNLEAYRIMDIFTNFSTFELESIPCLEAAATGLPLLLRDIEVFREKWGKNALYFSDFREFQEAVDALVGDEKFYRKMARKARRHAERNYSLKALGERLYEVYRAVLESSS